LAQEADAGAAAKIPTFLARDFPNETSGRKPVKVYSVPIHAAPLTTSVHSNRPDKNPRHLIPVWTGAGI